LDRWAHLWQSRNISIVSRKERLQDCQCGFIGCCSRKLEDGNGVGLGVIGTGLQLMRFVAFRPKRAACKD
jgi:hypothetical protein